MSVELICYVETIIAFFRTFTAFLVAFFDEPTVL